MNQPPLPSRRRWTLLAAGAAAAGACLFVLILFSVSGRRALDAESWAMAAAATVASFVVGGLCWRLLILRPRQTDLWRGVIAGGLTGLLTHPPTWYLLSLIYFFTGARSSLGERTLHPLEAIPGSLILAAGSLLIVGWLSVPLGMAGGALFLLFYRRQLRRQSSSAKDA
ncbi:MAG: hypothetical protein HUU23_08500 [Caldilineales bacterium]|nr:hypothetical protein [Caldilineales bacterium]